MHFTASCFRNKSYTCSIHVLKHVSQYLSICTADRRTTYVGLINSYLWLCSKPFLIQSHCLFPFTYQQYHNEIAKYDIMYDYSYYFFIKQRNSIFIFQGRLYLYIWYINNRKRIFFSFTSMIWNAIK